MDSPRRHGDTERDLITRATPISKLAGLLRTSPNLVHPHDSIYSLALASAASPMNRVVCVVDFQGTLLGLVPLAAIIENVFFEVGQASREVFAGEQDSTGAPGAPGETARDLMEAPLWVRPQDTVKDVVDRVLEAHLDGLPIVDGAMRVIGYVDAVELLGLWLGHSTARA